MDYDIHLIAVERVESILKAAGLRYVIELPNGKTVGELAQQVPPNQTRAPYGYFIEKYDYKNTCLAMEVNDSVEFFANSKAEATRLQASTSSLMTLSFGAGSAPTKVEHVPGDNTWKLTITRVK